MTITCLKWTLGLYRNQAEEICIYLGSDSALAAGLAKLVRGLKRDRQWKLVFMHFENPLLHPGRTMCAKPLIVSKTSGAVIIPRPLL